MEKLVYLDHNKYDIEKYPLLITKARYGKESRHKSEKDITPKERLKMRKTRFPNRLSYLLGKAEDNIIRKGDLFLVKNAKILEDLKESFTFIDENENEICLIKVLEGKVKEEDLPDNVTDLFMQYKKVVDTNLKLRERIDKLKSEGRSELVETEVVQSQPIEMIKAIRLLEKVSDVFYTTFMKINNIYGEMMKKGQIKSDNDTLLTVKEFKQSIIPNQKEREIFAKYGEYLKNKKEHN